MRHRLVEAIETALDWDGPSKLGKEFVRGTITDRSLLTRILTPTRLLELVMRRSLGNPQIRVFREGNELHPREYLTAAGNRRGQHIPMVNMRHLGALLGEGATLVLDGADVFDPTLEVAARAMQWWAEERTQVNLYLTTAEAASFGLHWDDHEVVVVQLDGEKQWEVRGPSRVDPMFRDVGRNDTPSEEVLWEGALSAGDVMHIPRGYWHKATRADCGDGHSFHMTIGFTRRTGAAWMESLAEWCRDDELFRRNLERDVSEEQVLQAQELIKAAAALAAERTPVRYLEQFPLETVPARQVPFLPTFGPLEAVVCTTPFPPSIAVHDGQVEFAAAGKRLSLTADAESAVRLLLSGHPVRLGSDVDGLTHGLADLLVKEGLCATLTPELSSGYTGLVIDGASSSTPLTQESGL
ncbi:JmjC domain-containing protein [Yinghuangia sp. YIM S09857]|uniref:JmjC domain-containing protein n=1 Tax=Yinghuangia sp. YIM S09857 TaxID=3436929 RepID=UPI003F52D54C